MKKKLILIVITLTLLIIKDVAQVGFNVDVIPTNVGGKEEFKRVFEQELIYPENALSNKEGGKVIVGFTLLKDSSATNIKVIQSISDDIDTEALRLFKLYQWVPAMKSGQLVNTNWSVTFDFNPDKYARICKQRGYTQIKYLANSVVDTSEKIYTSPEIFPIYPKGNYALQDFIKENLEYPRQAKLSNIQGTVVLSYIVEPSGLVTNIGIAKSVGGGCDQEAIRILQMITWYPGKNNDKLVRVKMSFPFYFVLNEDFKDNSSGEQH